MIKLHSLTNPLKTNKNRVGRGIAAGQGKTAGRGTKGQKSRSGYNIPRRFEGGQSALIQRLPKIRGFKSHRKKPLTINILRLEPLFEDKSLINLESLYEKGFISDLPLYGVKIIGKPSTKNVYTFEGIELSASLTKHFNM